MSQPSNEPTRRPGGRVRAARTAREVELLALIDHLRQNEARVADAIVTLLRGADAQTLGAFGVILGFVTPRVTRGRATHEAARDLGRAR